LVIASPPLRCAAMLRRQIRAGRGQNMRNFDLTSRVAIVTGGNGGIGFGMAMGMAEAGAAVVVAARNRDKSEAAVARLAAAGAKAAFVALNAADPESCRAMVTEA